MATEAQVNANRINAQKSCGPKTEAGRARVAQNRTTHSLSGQNVLLPGEDPEEFNAFQARFIVDHVPGSAIENRLSGPSPRANGGSTGL